MSAPLPRTAALDPASAARRDARWLMVSLVVLGLVLRLPLMGRSVWFDEACMSDQRIGTWPQLLATLYVDIHPPLYVVFMHVWNGLFGDGEWSMRLPSLVSGLVSIPLCYWAGHRLVGRAAALWAAALLTLSPVHVWYSAEARLYAPMLATTLLAVGCVDRLIDPAQSRRHGLWWLHLGNLAVMLSLHYYLAVHVLLLAIVAPLLRGFTPAVRRVVLAHGIGLALLAAFVAAKSTLGEFETSQGYLGSMTFAELYRFVFDWCWTGHTLPAADTALDRWAQQGGELLGVLLLAAGLGAVWRARRERPAAVLVPLGLLAIPAFLLLAAAAGLDHTYIPRSALPSLPFVFLLAGCGLTALPLAIGRLAGLAVLVMAVAALIALFRFHADHWTVYKPNGDWRAATRWLGAEIDAGAAGRRVFTPTPNPRPLSYYDARIQDVKNLRPAADPAAIAAKVRRRFGDWFGERAGRAFAEFAAHNAQLLAQAKLLVHRTVADPAELDLGPTGDVCYLVRDRWHPHESVDGTHEALLRHPRVEVLELHEFDGITVRKVRIRP